MLTSRLRLYFIYFLIAVTVVAGCIGVAAKFETADMKLQLTAQENTIAEKGREIAQLQEDRNRQDLVLAKLVSSRDTDNQVLASLKSDMDRLGIRQASAMQKISYLERSNVEVQKFLASPVPPDGCVLDDSCEGAATGSHHPPTK